MSDDLSPEASVAGEAAAAAVEEMHSRESVAEAASEAVATSSMAAEGSLEALQASQEAVQYAAGAEAQAEAARAVADDVAASVSETTDYAREAYDHASNARQEVSELRSLFEEFVNRMKPAETETPAVQEVPVNAAQTQHSEGTTSGTGEQPGSESGESVSGRRRLRRFNR